MQTAMAQFFILSLPILVSGFCFAAIPPQDVCLAEQATVAKHLEVFDDLDFNVFSNQKWDELSHSHADDIVVHWPDGRVTKGIQTHIEDLKSMFTYAPDTRIQQHPIRIGSGEWTSVTGVMEGTFTRPMVLADGTVIQPTQKKFKISMATFGHWKNGKMIEEHLFWDNAAFMKQLGVTE